MAIPDDASDHAVLPGLPAAVPVTVAFGIADPLCNGRAATLLRIHAPRYSVVSVVEALFASDIHPLSFPRLERCRPERDCVRLYLFVHGHLTPIQVSAALLPLALPGTLPHPI